VIDNKLKDEMGILHDQGRFDAERGEWCSRQLKERIPEPTQEDITCNIGREDKPPRTTAEGLRKLAEKKQPRKEELELPFNLNWSVTDPKVIEKVVDQC
jgi:hypothetical protein